jgi:hypothetical protein
MDFIMAKRGRPPGSKNKKTLIAEGVIDKDGNPVDNRTDDEVLAEIITRFDTFYRVTMGATQDDLNALIVSGAAGVGKSYTAEWVLDSAAEKVEEETVKGLSFNERSVPSGFRHTVVKGTITAIELYTLAYEYRHPNNVIVLDDSDRIFDDEEGLNVLKALLDTSTVRKVSWMTDHPRFKGDDGLPREYDYKGSMIFLTNKDFQSAIDGTARARKNSEHMAALMSRAIYLDLKMHTRREITLWVKHIVMENKILQKIGLSSMQEKTAVEWIVKNMDNLREISIRTALKVGRFMKMDAQKWEVDATVTLLK